MEEFNAKAKVFIHFNYFDQKLKMIKKGIAANEILPTDKILTVELM